MTQKYPEEPVSIELRDDYWEVCEELNQQTVQRLETVAKSLSEGDIDDVFISDFFDRLQKSTGNFDDGTVRAYVDEDLDDDGEVLFVPGDLRVPTLHDLEELNCRTLIVDGDLTVEHGIYTQNSPLEKLIVTGNLQARSLWTTGYLLVGKDLNILDSTWGEYPDNGAFICGNLTTNFFHGRHRFEVRGKLTAQYSIGYPSVHDCNSKPLADFLTHVNPKITALLPALTEATLASPGDEEAFWKFIDRGSLSGFVRFDDFISAK